MPEEVADDVVADVDEDLPDVTAPKNRKKDTAGPSSTSTETARLLQTLSARADQTDQLTKKLDSFVSNKDPNTNEQANWGQWMASCASFVPRNRWPDFLDQSYALMRQFVPFSLLSTVPSVSTIVSVSTVQSVATVPSVSTVSVLSTVPSVSVNRPASSQSGPQFLSLQTRQQQLQPSQPEFWGNC